MATTKGQFVLHGVHLDPATGREMEPASYPLDIPALADGGTFPGQIKIVADRDFKIQEHTHSFNGVGVNDALPIRIQAQTTGGRPWFIGKSVMLSAISSAHSGLPRRPLMQRIIKAGTEINFDVIEATI